MIAAALFPTSSPVIEAKVNICIIRGRCLEINPAVASLPLVYSRSMFKCYGHYVSDHTENTKFAVKYCNGMLSKIKLHLFKVTIVGSG